MHEVSIALAIVEQIEERLAAETVERVATVRLRVGALTGVVDQALEFAWSLATDGTIASGSALVVERVPLAIYCDRCACERAAAEGPVPLPVCPVCGESSAKIVRGRELSIVSMEVYHAPSSPGNPAQRALQEQHDGRRPPRGVPA